MEEDEPLKPEVYHVLETLEEFKKKDPIQMKQAKVRNVIFLGRARAGKTTVYRVLKNPVHVAKFGSIFSDTKEPCLNSFNIEVDGPDKPNYTINIIDTPGLFEITVADREARNNEILKNTILACLGNEIARIHAIFLVCSFETGLNAQDSDAIDEFVQLFQGAEKHLALLVTRAESLDEERKENLLNELRRVPSLRGITQRVEDRIFFTGALNEDVLGDNVARVMRVGENVKKMREKLLRWVLEMEDVYQLIDLKSFKDHKLEAQNNLRQLQQLRREKGRGGDKAEELRKELEKNERFFVSPKERQWFELMMRAQK